MDLAIDFGTSVGKLGYFEGNDLKEVVRGVTVEQLPECFNNTTVDRAIISSVTSKAEQIAEVIPTGIQVLIMSHELKLPVKITYETPNTLGTDRLAAIIGARDLFPQKNVLVIDAGTCITYDLLTEQETYVGGSISPGIELRFKALHNYTARLPLMERVNDADLVGTSTEKAILSGVINGIKAEMKEIIRMYRNKLPHLQLVICGGDASYYKEHLSEDILISPNLVLNGLKTVLDHNA